MGRLVVVSNRLPEVVSPRDLTEKQTASVGGLVSALRPALEASPENLWLGWSGRSVGAGQRAAVRTHRGRPASLVGIDLPETDVAGHYNGFCNGALWPLLHCFPGRVVAEATDHASYRRVNARFAQVIGRRLRPDDRVWVHDYHLFPLGGELRRRGFGDVPIGFFLHVPFPPHDIFSILPWARELLEDLLRYGLVAFQTARDAENYVFAVRRELGIDADARQRVAAHPISIDPRPYEEWACSRRSVRRARWLREAVRSRRLILGVDRLDYTKGIELRLRAFGRMLERHPRYRKRVCFIQISAPSRTRVAAYVRLRQEVEGLVGHLNGRFGEADWVPVRYLFRSYAQEELAAFYREADVGLVSPLRDGMNLVAKEYVACQAGDPGVLVLSRFAGAAQELAEAVIVNPHDVDGTADALARALSMPLGERRARQAALIARVRRRTAKDWAEGILADLETCRPPGETGTEVGDGAGPAAERCVRARAGR